MSPSEKQLISLISVAVLGVLVACLGLYFIPAFPYVTLIVLFCCIVFYCLRGDSLYTKAGPHPRRGPGIPLLLRRWLAGGAAGEGRTRTRSHAQVDVRFSDVYTRQRRPHADSTPYPGDTSLFSPRDVLMGSYVSKEAPAERPPGAGRSWAANPREQLRERLSRPNHAVLTPNRRLSFTRESVASPGKFVITPQRHYPLLQSGTASVGVLPPAHWDSFKKKNILSPRNCTTLHSPVTVKIARPDHSHRPPVLDYICSPGLGLPPDPCSTEGVLKVLKESRKRDVVEEGDGSFTAEQHSKRRRNDSGGSAHSAFEPLLPNGMTSQLVPKPGTLKRGTNSVEEAAVKRSRTSSISSGSAAPAPGGTPGSARNPINSSYSSSRGLGKWKKTLEHGSPLSSPGSSRSQTPERALKKPREDDVQCPSSVSVVAPDKTATRIAAVTSKQTPVAKLGVRVSSESSSGGKRKRKIQLVSSHREDQIYLPPPPELGYTVTGKDLDLEKKDALSKIQKSLEEPVLEKPGVAPASLPSAQTGTFSSTTTLSSLLAAPLSTATTAPVSAGAPIPVINLDPTPTNSTPQPAAAAAPASNPLLEALKTKSITPSSLPSTTLGITVSSSGDTQTQKPAITLNSSQPTSSVLGQPTSSSAPSAFTQVLNQATKPVTSAPIISGTSLFGMASPLSTSSATPTSAPPAYAPPTASGTGSAGSSNPLLVSGFKPIFMATPPTSTAPPSAQDNKPTVPNFKSLFGSTGPSTAFGASPSVTMATTSPPTAPTANPTASFGGLNGSRNVTASSLFPGSASVASAVPTGATPSTTAQPAAQPAVKPLFGAWGASSTTSTASTSTLASNTGNTFQFGAAAAAAAAAAPVTTVAPSILTTAAKTNSTFTFGSMVAAPTTTQATATQATPQNVFGFGQAAPTQNQPTASFGGFALANVPAAAATTAGTTAANNAPTTQSTFTFAKSAFDASAAPSAFPSLTSAAPKPFGFGTSTATAAPAPAPTTTPAPFSFGAGATSTTTSTFGTPAKPAFGAGSTGFPFGSTAAPAAAAAASTFGLSTQTQSAPPTSTFTFGSSAPQQTATLPSQPASGGFNFCSAVPSTQFGTPVSSNAAPQMASFNFGAATTDKPTFGTPTFGQSAAAGPTPFGSPATPIQSFSSAAPPPFGSPATPSFSIGAGSKPSGARQRLQARRQHTRKK